MADLPISPQTNFPTATKCIETGRDIRRTTRLLFFRGATLHDFEIGRSARGLRVARRLRSVPPRAGAARPLRPSERRVSALRSRHDVEIVFLGALHELSYERIVFMIRDWQGRQCSLGLLPGQTMPDRYATLSEWREPRSGSIALKSAEADGFRRNGAVQGSGSIVPPESVTAQVASELTFR